MKTVDIAKTVDAVPILNTREERMMHWASLVRGYKGGELRIFHNLEFMKEHQLLYRVSDIEGGSVSAFGLAIADPVFRVSGLLSEVTIGGLMKFFGLNLEELHEFSCNCGGRISNEDMASRIERLATNKPKSGFKFWS